MGSYVVGLNGWRLWGCQQIAPFEYNTFLTILVEYILVVH